MTKKNWLMTVALVALAGAYAFYFTGWFKPKIIHIEHTSRALHFRLRKNVAVNDETIPITFSLQPECKITELKVVPLSEWQTNQNALPVWHLVASSNAAPVKMFLYGQRIRGLKPEIPGSRPDPLQPDVTYRLFLTAGSAKGEHDFEVKAAE